MRKIYHYRYQKSGSLICRNRSGCNQKGGFTISVVESGPLSAIGVAKCNTADKYVNHVGNHMATKRAKEIIQKSDDKYVAIALPSVKVPKTIERRLMSIAKELGKEALSFMEL